MPDLMIILGASASGKTTLARRLSRDLAVPALGKDHVKEALFDVLGATDAAQSRRFSDVSFGALLRLARPLLDAGLSCVLEGNWRPSHAAAVQALLDASGARCAQVWCRAAPAEVLRRFTGRVRHPGHGDAGVDPHRVCAAAALPAAFLDVDGPRFECDSGQARSLLEVSRRLQSWRL